MRHYFVFIVLIIGGSFIISCGSSKSASSAYSGYQTKPSNSVQATSANRGVKIELEECEVMAMDLSADNPRAFGNGISGTESFATNIAILDARTKLAQQIGSYVKGLILNAQSSTGSANSTAIRAGELQTDRWNQYVSNARVIKKNTYVKEDGQYNVYVCVEMPKEQVSNLYNTLSKDKIISESITEKMFVDGYKSLITE